MKRVLCGAFAMFVGLIVATPAGAAVVPVDQTPGADLGGYIAQSSAMAFSLQPFVPALIPTGDVPVEGTVALSSSNVKSGGNAFARGAGLWMGSAAGDPGPLIGQGAGQPEFGAVFPKWPVQAQASQNDGEVTAGKDPFLLMTAQGFPDRSTGDTRMGDVNVPGLVHVEHVASTSTSLVRDTDVANDARVVLQGISLVAGHITIDQMRSYSATTSTGTSSTQSGDVVLSGLRIGGVNVTVTDAGFKIGGLPKGSEQAPGASERFPGQSPAEIVNTVLKSFNARLTMFRSIGRAAGGNADRLGGAFVLSIDNPVGGQGPIPPGRFDIILGSTSSTTQVTSQFQFSAGGAAGGGSVPDVPSLDGAATETGSGGSFSLGSGPEVSRGDISGTNALGSSGGSLDTGLQPSDYRFKGIPFGLVFALLLVAVVASRYIRRFMNSVISGGASR